MLQRQVLIFVCIAHLLFTATHNMPEIEAIPSHIPNRKRFKLKIQGNTPTANINYTYNVPSMAIFVVGFTFIGE